jgi:hypothetical protein
MYGIYLPNLDLWITFKLFQEKPTFAIKNGSGSDSLTYLIYNSRKYRRVYKGGNTTGGPALILIYVAQTP